MIIIQLAIIGNKELFGEEELYYEKKRETTAIVTSIEADIFALEKKVINYLECCFNMRMHRTLRSGFLKMKNL
jgi:hypothetical protein